MAFEKKKNLTEVISVRLPAELHAKFYAESLASDEKIGVVVRRYLERGDSNGTTSETKQLSAEEMERLVAATAALKRAKPPKPDRDTTRLQYLFNKTSNNMNQLAYRANADHLAGKLGEATYASILAELSAIRRALLDGIE